MWAWKKRKKTLWLWPGKPTVSFMLINTSWTKAQKRLSTTPYSPQEHYYTDIYIIGENEVLSSIYTSQHRTFLTRQWKIWKMKLCFPPCLGTSSTRIQPRVQKQCCGTGPKTFGLGILPLILPCYVLGVRSSKYALALSFQAQVLMYHFRPLYLYSHFLFLDLGSVRHFPEHFRCPLT